MSTSSSANNAYSQLVQRIKVNQPAPPQPVAPPPVASPPPEEEKEEAVDENLVDVVPPPISMQPIVDRTAFYVAKNGGEMLNMLKKNYPEKFGFLNATDTHHMFFQYKVALYKEMLEDPSFVTATKGDSAATKSQTDLGLNGAEKQGFEQVTAKFPSLKGFFRA